jgi:hypothetical protein
MNCTETQNALFNLERPDRPDAAMRLHLAGCDACRALHTRLVEAERALPQLIVPPSTRRDDFVHRVRYGEVVIPPAAASPWVLPMRPSSKERGLRKLAVAIALAAGLLVFVGSWWALKPGQDAVSHVQPDPLAVRQQERDRRLVAAHSPRERVEILADMAQKLNLEARQLIRAADTEKLQVVARFFREVVRDDLVRHARALSADELKTVVDSVSRQLIIAESEAQREVQRLEAINAPAATMDSLRDMALAARESHDQLRTMVMG